MISRLKNFFKGLARKFLKKTKSGLPNTYDLDAKILRSIRGRKFPKWSQLLQAKHVLSSKEYLVLRLSFLVFLFGLIWISYSYIGKFREEVPAVGGKYIEAVVGYPQLANPVFATVNDVDADITRLVYSGLIRFDEKQEIVTDLADGFEISEDNKTYTFKLKENIKWHDGEQLIARDVVYTFETIQNPAVNSPLFVTFQGVKVEAVGDFTVRFSLNQPSASFLSSLTVGILPEHIWNSVTPERMRLAQRNLQPVGSGPFMFKKFLKNDSGYIYRFELERFANYYGQPPFIKDFVFQFFNEYDGETGAIQALREQKVDGLSFVPSDLYEKVKRKHIILYTLQLPQYNALFFNLDRDVLKDKDLRVALTYALDKERILKEAINDEGQLIDGPILPGFPGYGDGIEKLEYNATKANEILDKKWTKVSAEEYKKTKYDGLLKEWESQNKPPEAINETTTSTENVVNQAQIDYDAAKEKAKTEIEQRLDAEINEAQLFYRKDKEGNFLSMDLTTVETKEFKFVAEMIASFWQEVGVMTNIRLIPARDFSKEVLKNRDYGVLLYGVIIGNDPDQYPFWHSSQVEFPGLNLSKYANRNVDALIEEAQKAKNQEELAEKYKKAQDLILAERPAAFLFMPIYTYASGDKVKGIDTFKIAYPSDRFADIETWYIKTKGKWNFSK